MFKFLLLFIIIFSSLFIINSCKAKDLKTNSQNYQLENSRYERVEGLVEVYGDEVYIVINPNCKCRRSLKVIGDKKEKLKNLNGLFVEVEGYIKLKTPWSGEITVEKIYRLEK